MAKFNRKALWKKCWKGCFPKGSPSEIDLAKMDAQSCVFASMELFDVSVAIQIWLDKMEKTSKGEYANITGGDIQFGLRMGFDILTLAKLSDTNPIHILGYVEYQKRSETLTEKIKTGAFSEAEMKMMNHNNGMMKYLFS